LFGEREREGRKRRRKEARMKSENGKWKYGMKSENGNMELCGQ
jgi:hypothetical protein